MNRLQIIVTLALAPLLVAGLWLWREQGAFVWISGVDSAKM